MIQFRNHLRQLAAFVLLVWVLAAVTAMAHACVTHVHVDSDGCCVGMEATTLRSDAASEAAAPVQPAQPWLASAIHAQDAAEPPREQVLLPTARIWDDSGQRLHVVLLRLAL